MAKLLDKLKNKIKDIFLPTINLSRLKQISSDYQKKSTCSETLIFDMV